MVEPLLTFLALSFAGADGWGDHGRCSGMDLMGSEEVSDLRVSRHCCGEGSGAGGGMDGL